MKNNGNFLLGLILIIIGGLWIAGTVGLIELSMLYMLFRFWPVLLIVAGINILFKGNKGVLLLTILLLVAGGLYAMQYPEKIPGMKAFQFNGDYKWGDPIVRIEDKYDLADIETASFELNLGAGDIYVASTGEDQFLYSVPDYNLSRSLFTDNDGAEILFKHNKGFGPFGYKDEDDVNFYFELPEDIVWKIEVDAGAADATLNLQNLMVESLDVNTGASDTKLILGDKNAYTFVELDSGVSDFEINIKEGVGLRIESDNMISDNNFEASGLKKNDEYYETPNYEEADKKIEIEIDSAISDIQIKFY